MVETFVFSSESVFLNQESQTMAAQFLEYLKRRKQRIGMVFNDQQSMNQVLLAHGLAEYFDFSINGEAGRQVAQSLLDFLKDELQQGKVHFISNSLSQLQEAESLGFAPIYVNDDCYKEGVPCRAYEDYNQLHLAVIADRFEELI
ncbi:HAD family hydrolase [Enterococcus viikkiensis]|uniref:HAD family hydrolase n=1 Tax=Enterococcus viikkiensis TaxID=930854 RepID=UPI0010F9D7A8|nr:HAD family hydrolase [Enterococcus viikkiensis]